MKAIDFKEYFRIFKLVKPGKVAYSLLISADCLTEISFYLLTPVVMKFMIDAAVNSNPTLLHQGLLLTLAISGFGMVSFVSLEYFLFSSFYKTTSFIRIKLYEKILKLPIVYSETHHSGDTLSRLNNDVKTMQEAYGWPFRMIIVRLLSGLSSALVMFFLDWKVSILLIVIGLISVLINSRQTGKVRGINDEIQKSMGKYTENLANIIGGFTTMKSLGLEPEMMKKAISINGEILDGNMKLARKNAAMESRNFLFGSINFVGVVILASFLALKGISGLGSVVSMVYLLGNVNSMFAEFNGILLRMQSSLAGAKRVTELLESDDEPHAIDAEGSKECDAMIVFEDIEFSYKEDCQTLNGINLTIHRGQVAALAGPSGGGKSTIMKLLLGYYSPSAGKITIDGRALKDLTLSELRSLIAYVPQDAYIFDGTVEENIRLGRPDAAPEEVLQAAKAANADEFIRQMEQGYQTLVGERGVRLSGGQRQRIAIARAFLKNAPILLLDEATSSLDSQSESQVQAALEGLIRNKTVLVIAHRLSTIENADVIYLVEEGRIVESGTHEDLLKNGDLYHHLHNIQFALNLNTDEDVPA
jgi:ABC-type multidrug transport system fused ATPase/permease subunit